MFENINVDWNLSHDDGSTDFSDDDTVIDERVSVLIMVMLFVKSVFCDLLIHRGI